MCRCLVRGLERVYMWTWWTIFHTHIQNRHLFQKPSVKKNQNEKYDSLLSPKKNISIIVHWAIDKNDHETPIYYSKNKYKVGNSLNMYANPMLKKHTRLIRTTMAHEPYIIFLIFSYVRKTKLYNLQSFLSFNQYPNSVKLKKKWY